MRDQDRRPSPLDAVGQDREERERDDDGRKHERDDDERAHHTPAPEAVATEHVRRGKRDRDREHGRRERLPHGEPHDLARQRIREDVERRVACATQAPLDDRRDGIEEEQREEGERNPEREQPPRAAAHRTTMSVHSSTQRSRFSSISSGGSSSGDSGTTANCSNSGGSAASRPCREDEHLQRDVLLEALREHEVDQLARAVLVLRAAKDAGELDLPEAAVLDDTRRRFGRPRIPEDHLGGRARRIGDDDRAVPLAPGRAGEARVVRVLPAVDDEDVVRAQLAPVALPAVSELRDRREHEREARRRGRGVLDDELSRDSAGGSGRRGSAAVAGRARRTTPCRS